MPTLCPIFYHGWLASSREQDPTYDLTCKGDECALWDDGKNCCVIYSKLEVEAGEASSES